MLRQVILWGACPLLQQLAAVEVGYTQVKIGSILETTIKEKKTIYGRASELKYWTHDLGGFVLWYKVIEVGISL